MRGADTVVREIIRSPWPASSTSYFADVNTQQIEQWFNLGGTVQLNDAQPSAASLERAEADPGPLRQTRPLPHQREVQPEIAVSAAEFLLEGMTAHKRISRSEERSFSAAEKKQRNTDASQFAERVRERDFEDPKSRSRRGFN